MKFIVHIIQETNFTSKWIRMKEEMVSTPSFSIIAQGSSHGFFQEHIRIKAMEPAITTSFHNRDGNFHSTK